jgi:hypothetical protein
MTGPGPADGTAAGKHELGLELHWKASTAGEAGWDSAVGQQGCRTQTCFMPPRCVPADVAATNYGTSVQLSAHGQLKQLDKTITNLLTYNTVENSGKGHLPMDSPFWDKNSGLTSK